MSDGHALSVGGNQRTALWSLAALWAVPCLASAQMIQAVQAIDKHYILNEPVQVHIQVVQPEQSACGVLVSDGDGRAQRLLVHGSQGISTWQFARDGRYQVQVQGKPLFEAYELYWACEGEASLQVKVESKANRAKRLAAAAAAKKAAEERATAESARQAAEAAARAEEERTAAQRAVERQKAALEAAARQRALETAQRIAQAKAELEAARKEAKRLADQTPLDRIKTLFASKEAEPAKAEQAQAAPAKQ